MNSNLLSCFCALLLVNLALAEPNCLIKKYSLDQAAGCSVKEQMDVNFVIKETLPDQTSCDMTKTVCVESKQTGTTVALGGTFAVAITSVTVEGGGKTASIPVVHVAASQTFAKPMVARFPSDAAVKVANALTFTVDFDNGEITPTTDLLEGTAGSDCTAGKLCVLVAGRTIKLYGKKAALTSVTVTGAPNAKAIIPLIIAGPAEPKPSPALLEVPADGVLTAYKPITVDFTVVSVTGVGGDVTEKLTCATGTACYELFQFPRVATFGGVFPAAPLTIILKGQNDQEFISYYFGSASAALKTGLLTAAAVVVTLFMTA